MLARFSLNWKSSLKVSRKKRNRWLHFLIVAPTYCVSEHKRIRTQFQLHLTLSTRTVFFSHMHRNFCGFFSSLLTRITIFPLFTFKNMFILLPVIHSVCFFRKRFLFFSGGEKKIAVERMKNEHSTGAFGMAHRQDKNRTETRDLDRNCIAPQGVFFFSW